MSSARHLLRASGALLTLGVSACSQPFTAELTERTVLDLRIEPSQAVLTTSPSGGGPQQFVAMATWSDGAVEPLPAAEWTLSNTSTGDIDETGLFVPSRDNGGVSYVRARFDGVGAEAELRVEFEDAWVEEGADPALFTGTAATAALWRYPEDGVNIPRNTPSITFQWSAAALPEAPLCYMLRFQSAITDIRVYTTATSWSADEETWASLAATNAGGSLTVTVAAATAASGVFADAPRDITINRMDGQGEIYYWSTSAAGVKRIPYGGAAADYLSQGTTGYCIGCHAVSSQGRMAFSFDGGNGAMGLLDTSNGGYVAGHESGATGNFKTFSPDGSRLLVTFAGDLFLYDGVTGAFLSAVPLEQTVTHVDWSPDGTLIALTATTSHPLDWTSGGGAIAVMEVLGDGSFGPLQMLYDPPDPTIAYYPAFSPDGDWIAFNVSTEDTYDDVTATLMVMPAEGGTPIPLVAANQAEGLTNSWPRWGPLPDDDILWLAFSSKRAYGDVVNGLPQLWVAAFDPAAAAAGEDPSFPAFWLPGQDATQSNHIPVWAP